MPSIRTPRYISDGEQANAAVANRPLADMQSTISYILERLDEAGAGQSVQEYGVTVSGDVFVGAAVYYDSENDLFDLALAAADSATNGVQLAETAQVRGVVSSLTGTSATIVLFGKISDVDMEEATGEETPSAGVYYLSASEPGTLTRTRPSVAVPVLYSDGNGGLYIQPNLREFASDHVHRSFSLYCKPAGTAYPPDTGGRHVIVESDVAETGWLPAEHSSFNGNAPAGAAFGYNFATHAELSAVWPPSPINSVVLFFDKATSAVGGTQIPLGQDGLCVVDANGIWWMSDCNGDVPWPSDYDSGVPSATQTSSPSPECSRFEEMALTLSFTSMLFATDTNAVTQLSGDDAGIIEVVNSSGAASTTGSLSLRFNAAMTRNFLPGILASNSEGAASDYNDVPYEGLPSGTTTILRAMVQVPTQGLSDDPRVKIRFVLLAVDAGTLPTLSIGYRVMGDVGLTATATPTTDTWESAPVGVAANAGRFVVLESGYIDVAAGDLLMISLKRTSGDGYAGTVGVIDQGAVLYGA